jgi:methionyl-tRNA formyltransferase
MRIVFMGTPDFAVPTLAEMLGAGHEVVAVYSRAPSTQGRGLTETPSPVHAFAAQAGLRVLTPKSLRTPDAQEVFRSHAADVAVVVAYGLILPKPILDAPVHGCLNLHGSKLPRWRGAAPIQRAVMSGDTETAAMVMQMDEGLDTGPVCLAEAISIGPDMTASDLHDVMMLRGASLVVRALAALERGSLVAMPQPADGITYAAKIEKSEARIDFSQPASRVHNHIRGLSPFPGAWFEIQVAGKLERLKVLRSLPVAGREKPGTVLDDALTLACGDGAVRLVEVQRAGKKPMTAEGLLRGLAIKAGMVASVS